MNKQKRDLIGSVISHEDIAQLRRVLAHNYRDRLLFELCISSGLTISTLLQLKLNNFLNVKPFDQIIFSVRNEMSKFSFYINNECYQSLQLYLSTIELKPTSYLFKSRKGDNPLNLSSVSNIIKAWFKDAGVEDKYSARSLRTTAQYFINQELHGSISNGYPNNLLVPIEYQEIQEIVCQRLYDMIISGSIPPGTKLTITEISKQLDVSQTPVRMALSWLANKGLIKMIKKKGCMVRELTPINLEEIIIIRTTLEVVGFKLAWPYYTQDTIALLSSILEEYKNAKDWDTFQQAHRNFHLSMCRDAKLPLLFELINNLIDRTNAHFIHLFSTIQETDANRQKSIKKHETILSFIKNGKPDRVIALIEEDLQEGHEKITSIFNDNSIVPLLKNAK
jgi:DNA-binding GntR family transcriptional regulator